MADEATVRKVVERFFEFTGADVARAEELYHPDAVLEFLQSGERFEGRSTFTEWRSQYPVQDQTTCSTGSRGSSPARTSPRPS